MSTCTFFGHRQCPSSIKPNLKNVLINLIEHQKVNVFYVGNQGSFDDMVYSVLRKLSQQYSHITYAVVLAYLPSESKGELSQSQDYTDTIYPEGIESVPKRFAIDWRNRWMLKQADYVVTYITHSWGGAAKYEQLARKHEKIIYNLSNLQ